MPTFESITVVKRKVIWVNNMPLEPGEGFSLLSPLQTSWAENTGTRVLKRYKGTDDRGMVAEKPQTTVLQVINMVKKQNKTSAFREGKKVFNDYKSVYQPAKCPWLKLYFKQQMPHCFYFKVG